MDEFDPFDPERFRLSPELAAKLAKARAERAGSGKPAPKRARSQKRFTKFPGIWEEVLAKARVSGATYAVTIVLLHEAWKSASNGYRPDVKLTDVMLKRVHVGPKGKRAALRRLSGLGLAGVQWRANRNPIVTVYFLE